MKKGPKNPKLYKKPLSYSTNKNYYLVFLKCCQIQLGEKKIFARKRGSENSSFSGQHINAQGSKPGKE